MPELPEVETVKRSLEPLVKGRIIEKTDVFYSGIIKKPATEEFIQYLQGKEIQGIKRRGKYLLFSLGQGGLLVIHLRMTGQLVFSRKGEELIKHTHLVFHLSGGDELRFIDIRKFGLVYLIPTGKWEEAGGLSTLGPEPLEAEFSLSAFQKALQQKKVGVKAFLLDQRNIAGIGNIYADEILFTAGLRPQRNVNSIVNEEAGCLYDAIRAVLAEGIKYRGTSIRDYVDGKGERGRFQEKLKVYDRAGKSCVRCGTVLVKETVAGRGTVYCPSCQV